MHIKMRNTILNDFDRQQRLEKLTLIFMEIKEDDTTNLAGRVSSSIEQQAKKPVTRESIADE